MKKSNFLFIITDLGSFNNFLSEISIELSKYFSVHVICSNSKIINTEDRFLFSNFDITFHNVYIPRKVSILSLLFCSFKIYNLVTTIKPILVHSHFTTGILPSIIFKARDIKYVGTFHGLGMNSTKGFIRWMFILVERFCFKRLDKILLINDIDFIRTNKLYSLKSCKIDSYGLGCDINRFDLTSFSDDTIKKEKIKLGIDNKFIISFVGRFVDFKGFDVVIKVFHLLIKEFPDKFSLLLIGGVDPIHCTGLDDNESFINNNGIINVGFTANPENYLALSDLFFFPSKKEGLPVCVLEALSMGVPVLSYKERGMTDLIINWFNGILIKSISKELDILLFKNIILNLFRNIHRLEYLSKNSIINRDIYSRSHYVEKQIEFYFDLLSFPK